MFYVEDGASAGVEFYPNPGYKLYFISVDGTPGGLYPVDNYWWSDAVHANHTIYAQFIPDTYTITSSAGENGKISPDGETEVDGGDDQAYSIIPAPGYTVLTLTIDGVDLPKTQRSLGYTFVNVSADHTISCTFAKDEHGGGGGPGDGIPDIEQPLQTTRPLWQASPGGHMLPHIGPLGV